jgi:hypothetical protein
MTEQLRIGRYRNSLGYSPKLDSNVNFYFVKVWFITFLNVYFVAKHLYSGQITMDYMFISLNG